MRVIGVETIETLGLCRNQMQSIQRAKEYRFVQPLKETANLFEQGIGRPDQLPESLHQVVLELALKGPEGVLCYGTLAELAVKCGGDLRHGYAGRYDDSRIPRQAPHTFPAGFIEIEFRD